MIQDRFATLTLRERLVLLVGGAVAAAILLYVLAWRPWQEELSRLRSQVPEKQQTLAWMRAQATRIEALSHQSRDRSSETGLPLLTLIERSANQLEIRGEITRMSPGDRDNQVRVWMDGADFDRWLRWLETLNDNGVGVAEASIDRAAENRVNIRTTLQR